MALFPCLIGGGSGIEFNPKCIDTSFHSSSATANTLTYTATANGKKHFMFENYAYNLTGSLSESITLNGVDIKASCPTAGVQTVAGSFKVITYEIEVDLNVGDVLTCVGNYGTGGELVLASLFMLD